jgi:hypothetical protein
VTGRARFPSEMNSSRGGGKSRARVLRGALYGARNVPRHDAERGGAASTEEKPSTARCCPPCERERMRTSSSLRYLMKGYGGLGLGQC